MRAAGGLCRRGVTTVYVYQVDNRKIERQDRRVDRPLGGSADPRWMLAGGVLIAVSLFFGFVDMHADTMNISVSVSGWDMLKICFGPMGNGQSSMIGSAFVIPALMGASIAVSSWMSVRGTACLPDRWLAMMAVLCIGIHAVLFFMICSQSSSAVSLVSLSVGNLSVRPGAGLLMQIAGSIIVLRTFWKNRG